YRADLHRRQDAAGRRLAYPDWSRVGSGGAGDRALDGRQCVDSTTKRQRRGHPGHTLITGCEAAGLESGCRRPHPCAMDIPLHDPTIDLATQARSDRTRFIRGVLISVGFIAVLWWIKMIETW